MKNKSIKVGLASEKDRYQTVFRSLDYIFADITPQIYTLDPEKDYIILKPNCIDTKKEAAVTSVEALTAVLDFIQPIWQGRIILAEGAGLGNTMEAFNNFKYLGLKNSFPNLEFLDLNFSDCICVEAFDQNLKPMQIKISNTVAEAPLRISVGPPKTHDSVIVTLSIKNMAVGSILKEDKMNIHQGIKAINRTIAAINKYTFPHLSVIDGWKSMQGNGPVDGEIIETHFAASSTNCLAADVLATQIMGFNPVQIGYLNYLGAADIINLIQTVGYNPNNFNFHLKPPPTYLEQIQWN
ncbi:MAG: DUF362 domain-containing protein [Patescibacteria group bacterium]|nr:DUF362 domain-containing protein [Patescibacteria group bacterium]